MSEEDKFINIITRYSQQGAEEVAKATKLVGKEADDFYEKQANNWDNLGKDFQDYQKNYQAGAANVASGAQGMKEGIKDQGLDQAIGKQKLYTNTLQESNLAFRSLRAEARSVGIVSRELATVGAMMTAGILLEAKTFISTVGLTTAAGAQWLATEDKIKQANLQIGATAADVVLPSLQKTATYMTALAGIVKENPWLMEGALSVGGVLTAIGGIGLIVMNAMRMVANLGMIAVKMGINPQALMRGGASQYGVAGGQIGPAEAGAGSMSAGAAVAVGVLALAVGAALGNALGNAINKAMGQQEQNLGDNMMTVVRLLQLPMTALIKGLGTMIPGFTGAANAVLTFQNNLDHFIGTIVGASDDLKQESDKQNSADGKGGMITQQQVQTFINYQQQMLQAEQEYDSQRAATVAEFGQKMVESESNYQRQRSQIINDFESQQAQTMQDRQIAMAQMARDFARSQEQAERSYAEQRAKSKQSFENAEKDAEQAHQKALLKLAQDHAEKRFDLLGQRDALGLVLEDRAYKKKVDEENQNFADDQKKRNRDYAQQLTDQKRAFEEQRAQQLADYQQKLADQAAANALADQRAAEQEAKQLAQLDEQHKLEQEKLKKQEEQTLSTLQTNYEKQQKALTDNLSKQLEDLDLFMGNDRKLKADYYAAETADLEAWIAANRGLLSRTAGGENVPGKALGGSAAGRTLVGERGPEIVDLPLGSYVHTNSESKAMAAAMARQSVAPQQQGGLTLQFYLGQSGNMTEFRSMMKATENRILSTIAKELELA